MSSGADVNKLPDRIMPIDLEQVPLVLEAAIFVEFLKVVVYF
jgi:hypothetical protein